MYNFDLPASLLQFVIQLWSWNFGLVASNETLILPPPNTFLEKVSYSQGQWSQGRVFLLLATRYCISPSCNSYLQLQLPFATPKTLELRICERDRVKKRYFFLLSSPRHFLFFFMLPNFKSSAFLIDWTYWWVNAKWGQTGPLYSLIKGSNSIL